MDEIIKALRAQMADFEAKIADLQKTPAASAAELKAVNELIATLKSEVEAVRGDLAARQAAPAPKEDAGWDIFGLFKGE